MAEFEGFVELEFSCGNDEDAQALRSLAQEWINAERGKLGFSEDEIDTLSWLVGGWDDGSLSIHNDFVMDTSNHGDTTRKRVTAFLNEVVDRLPGIEFKGALDVFDVMRGIQRAKINFDSGAIKSTGSYIRIASDDGEAPKTIGDGTDYINKSGTITIPEGVVAIADRAFEYEHRPERAKPLKSDRSSDWNKYPKGFCSHSVISIAGINPLPSSLRLIGNSAFSEWLPERGGYRAAVSIPKDVEHVGIGAFAGFNKVTVYDCYDRDKRPATRESWLEGRDGSAWRGCLTGSFDRTLLGWISSTDDKRYLDQGVAELEEPASPNLRRPRCSPIEIEVRSAETDEVKYRTWMPINDPGEEVLWMLASAWGGGASVYFPAFDEVFDNLRWATPGKVGIALFRLRWPFGLSGELKEKYEAFIKAGAKAKMAARLLIADDDAEGLRLFEHLGLIKKGNIDELIEYAVKGKNKEHVGVVDEHHPEWIKRKGKSDACPECAQYLMEFKENHFKSKARK